MAYQNLTWTSFRNTDAYPNPNDLRKISGVQGAYDADAVSSEQIASAAEGAGIKFSLSPWLSGGVACGLSADNPDANYDTIDFCIMRFAGDFPTLRIYENGVQVWDSGFPPPAPDVYTIQINAEGKIEYYIGDTLLYTSLNSPSFPLFADASIDVNGTRVSEAQINVGVAAAPQHLMSMKVG